ncbi:MAG TPA: hypothetical protein DCP92_14175, partial [Nitrospiraceae bacterium]|nr:hypothetical protein [Nitrospiraceae bacterium]
SPPEGHSGPEAGCTKSEEFADSLSALVSHVEPRGGMTFLGISNPLLGLGDLERRSLSLRSVAPEPCLKISSKRADQLALSEGSVASLSTAAGSAEFKVVIDPDMPDDLVIIPQMCGGAAMV